MSDEGKFNPEEWFEKKFKEIRNIMHDDVKKLSVDEYKKLTDFHRENEKQMEEFFMEKNKDRDKDDRIHMSDYQNEQKGYYDFIDKMNLAYEVADIIISRAGASSISELCIVGKPVIFYR